MDKYRAFAIQFENGCANKFYATFETDAYIDSPAFNDVLISAIEKAAGATTCLVHYCKLNEDGSSQLNNLRFVWTAYELHKY